MKREQLTNVTTESIDQRCAELADNALGCSKWIVVGRQRAQLELDNPVAYAGNLSYWLEQTRRNKRFICSLADRIIALRTQEVQS